MVATFHDKVRTQMHHFRCGPYQEFSVRYDTDFGTVDTIPFLNTDTQ